MDPEPFKLISPFNLLPDGGPESKVIGVGVGQYPEEGGMAVFLLFENGRGQSVSTPLPESAAQLGEDEFFLKDWADGKHVAHRIDEEGLISPSGKPPVSFGHGEAAIAKLNRGKLVPFAEQEREKYQF